MTNKEKNAVAAISMVLLWSAIIPGVCAGETAVSVERSTASVATPALLWAKTYSAPIDSIAAGKTGGQIAVAVSPHCVAKDTTTVTALEYYSNRADNGKDRICSGGYIEAYDSKGRLNWKYPEQPDKDFIGVYNLSASADGNYFAASALKRPCHLETRYRSDADGWSYFKVCNWDTVFLNSKGQVVWSRNARGIPRFTPNGNHIVVIPYTGHADEDDDFQKNEFWRLLDISDGHELWSVELAEDVQALATAFSEAVPSSYLMSTDGKRLVMNNAVYELTDSTVTRIPLPANLYGTTDKRYIITGISPNGNYVITHSARGASYRGSSLGLRHYTGLSIWNIKTGQESFHFNGILANELWSVGIRADEDFIHYFQYSPFFMDSEKIKFVNIALHSHPVDNNTELSTVDFASGKREAASKFVAQYNDILRYSLDGKGIFIERASPGAKFEAPYDELLGKPFYTLSYYNLAKQKFLWTLKQRELLDTFSNDNILALTNKKRLVLEIYDNANLGK